MDVIQIIGFSAAVFITVANFPQVYKIIKDKNTDGISVMTYLSLILGNGLWLVYGILKVDWPIILTNAISTLSSCAILFLNFTPQKNIETLHESVLPEAVKAEVREKENNAETT